MTMRRIVLRALTASVALLVTVGLTGCSTLKSAEPSFDQLEKTVKTWPGVEKVSVSGSYNGLPTSRNLSFHIDLADASRTDLPQFVDDVLALGWSFDAYKPEEVSISIIDLAIPPAAGYVATPIDLHDAMTALDIPDVFYTPKQTIVSEDELEKRYGSWPTDSPAPVNS
jgi:hypothetical protein